MPAPTRKRTIRVHNGHPRLRFARAAVARIFHTLDEKFPSGPDGPAVPAGEISVAFLTNTALARLHESFLNDPTPTDVITFTGSASLGQAGEICVSADYARAFAQKHQRDFSGELTLYLVHGWLHLAGFDDLQPAKKKRMRAAEARALKLLTAAGRLPHFTLA